MEMIIVTGLSGAGKSQALKSLEDSGYYCVDNIPPVLIPRFAELCQNSMDDIKKVALVVDIRGGRFFDDLFQALDELDGAALEYQILFLDARDEVLIKRYKETRRSHPMQLEGRIEDGIALEREKLKNLKLRSNSIIDTSDLTSHQLRSEVRNVFVEGGNTTSMTVNITSFGFKKGILLDADLVFDVRFLPNPYYIDELKLLTGHSDKIQDYVMQFEEAQIFLDKMKDMVDFLIPQYIKEGKNQLVIGIGCTGGKHRSVTLTHKLHDDLVNKGHRVSMNHREIKER